MISLGQFSGRASHNGKACPQRIVKPDYNQAGYSPTIRCMLCIHAALKAASPANNL